MSAFPRDPQPMNLPDGFAPADAYSRSSRRAIVALPHLTDQLDDSRRHYPISQSETAQTSLITMEIYTPPLKRNRTAAHPNVASYFDQEQPRRAPTCATTRADHAGRDAPAAFVPTTSPLRGIQAACTGRFSSRLACPLEVIESNVPRRKTTTTPPLTTSPSPKLHPRSLPRCRASHFNRKTSPMGPRHDFRSSIAARNRKDNGPKLAILRKLCPKPSQTRQTKISIRRKRNTSGMVRLSSHDPSSAKLLIPYEGLREIQPFVKEINRLRNH